MTAEDSSTVAAVTPRQRPLVARSLTTANKAHRFLRAEGFEDLARPIAEQAERWKDELASVVVSGDIKRGKSSLINALVGRPGLLPVDADVATAAQLVLRYGEDGAMVVTRAALDGTRASQPLPPEELLAVASMAGTEEERQGVLQVDVLVDHPLLERGLAVVDTPGVGGMAPGHRDIAMAALQRADGLLFTISSQEPIARTELEFLADASERVGTVILVLTRCDLASDEANAAMALEDRAKLAAFAAQLQDAADASGTRHERANRMAKLADAPLVLTSSHLAEQAAVRAAAGREDSARRLLERSGLAQLEHLLRRTVDRREDIRLAGVLQVLATVLEEARNRIDAERRALEGDGSVDDELTAQKAALDRTASSHARWRASLQAGMQRLQTELGREVSNELGRVRDTYRGLLETVEDVKAAADAVPVELERSLHASWETLSRWTSERFDSIVRSLADDLEIEGLPALFTDLRLPEEINHLAERGGIGPGNDFSALQDGLPIATGAFMFGNMTNVAAGALGVATGGLGLVAYGIGAAISFGIGGARKRQRERMQASASIQRYLTEALFGQDGVSRAFTSELTLHILDARVALEAAIEERLLSRRSEIEGRAKELQQLARTAAQTRANRQREVAARLKEIDGLLAQAAQARSQLRDDLTAGVDPTPASSE